MIGDEITVDLFAGGGGASLGYEMATGCSPDVAVNHDAEAVAMHEANHPRTLHLCGDVWEYDPRELFRGQGFPDTYVIDPVVGGRRLTATAQVRMCGNSVSPPMAAALVAANYAPTRLEVAA